MSSLSLTSKFLPPVITTDPFPYVPCCLRCNIPRCPHSHIPSSESSPDSGTSSLPRPVEETPQEDSPLLPHPALILEPPPMTSPSLTSKSLPPVDSVFVPRSVSKALQEPKESESVMGAEEKTPAIANSMQRVKFYRLNADGKWDDRGTGHVTVDYFERSEELGLFVIDEEDNNTLLAHRIRSEEIYRKQEDTIISWRDPENSTDLALSFQESTGCSYIWYINLDHICSVQRNRNLNFNTLSNLEIGPRPASETLETSGASHANDEAFHSVKSEFRELPAVQLSTLPLILKVLMDNLNAPFKFVCILFSIFFLWAGGLQCTVDYKLLVLLNNPQILEKIFGDEFIMDIIGSLEYDPEVPHVQHHRAFLKDHVVFKEAIPIKDPLVLSKIHQTYRVGYLKEFILPRVLDEATVANLNSIIHANNAIVVSLLKDDSTFIQELFARMRSSSTSAESKKNLVFFLHEFCSLSKSLQPVQQLRLFRDLMNEGIFDIITDTLQSEDNRVVLTGTDILILFLSQDPNLLRSYVIRQEGNPLLGLLVKGMITDFGEDMHCQFLEILRSLLDSFASSGSQRDTIIEIFYEKHLDQLIEVITSSCPSKGVARSMGKSSGSGGRVENQGVTKPEILSNICELLCFCVLHHPYRIKCNFLLNNVIEKVLFLTHRREKYLVVAAVRFVRTIISRNDEHLLCHIAENNLLKPIVEAFVGNGNRYNLLNSAVLELFEHIRKENLKTLVIYVVDYFWNQLAKFEFLTSIHELKVKYEQSLENCKKRRLADLRKRVDERALEKEEEDYFNEDSDEEDTASAHGSHTLNQQAKPVLFNGVSCPSLRLGSGGLVDYDDDDDEDFMLPGFRQETFSGEDKTADSSPKSKRKSNTRKEHELTKKHRLDKTLKDGVVDAASPNKKTFTTEHTTHTPDGSSGSDEETHGEKEPAAPRSCSNCLSNTSDTRHLNGEDCALIPPNGNISTSEMALNGANVTGSEPYSVR
ncbi:hypothetical protein HHK36_020870 [Tetracentron sinense]|uniref:Serine/threonine-protein phosphatase 4 regulatory subunit 3-like central domain-containing protein n=1 Tax=Tetracentron sinense TaxID=13715 RepID=A0A835DC10_TETSI|nr:hypothetical protein HHK36_020870 [Tetracentron sinense]